MDKKSTLYQSRPQIDRQMMFVFGPVPSRYSTLKQQSAGHLHGRQPMNGRHNCNQNVGPIQMQQAGDLGVLYPQVQKNQADMKMPTHKDLQSWFGEWLGSKPVPKNIPKPDRWAKIDQRSEQKGTNLQTNQNNVSQNGGGLLLQSLTDSRNTFFSDMSKKFYTTVFNMQQHGFGNSGQLKALTQYLNELQKRKYSVKSFGESFQMLNDFQDVQFSSSTEQSRAQGLSAASGPGKASVPSRSSVPQMCDTSQGENFEEWFLDRPSTHYLCEDQYRPVRNFVQANNGVGVPNRVVLFVNIPCTLQLKSWQFQNLLAYYQEFSSQGLEILAFPCSQFSDNWDLHEPSIYELAQQSQVHIPFKLMEKASIKGDFLKGGIQEDGTHMHPIFEFFQKKSNRPVTTDFQMFPVTRDGDARYHWNATSDPNGVREQLQMLLNLPLSTDL